MGLGDMLGKAAGALGEGEFDIAEKMGELGIDPSMLSGLDLEAVKAMAAEKGLDLSMLEGLGIDIDDLLAKFMGGE
ncbi:MAG: hypothetical protein AAGD04_05360 [Pseudomonadota bacterium]